MSNPRNAQKDSDTDSKKKPFSNDEVRGTKQDPSPTEPELLEEEDEEGDDEETEEGDDAEETDEEEESIPV